MKRLLSPFARIGLAVRGGLAAGLLVLVPMFVAAELIVRGYESRMVEDVRARVSAGLDTVVAFVDVERTRTLNNAEVAGVRLGAPAQAGPSDELLRQVAATRTALRTSLVALVDGAGRTTASDPASNLSFGTQFDTRQAYQGKPSVGIYDRNPGIAIQAAAPLRAADALLPGAAIVAQTLDDGYLNTLQRTSGLEIAIAQNGRVTNASRGLRRAMTLAADNAVEADLVGQPGDVFRRSRFGSESFFVAARGILTGDRRELGTLIVALSADAIAERTLQARLLTYVAALVGAVLAWFAGRLMVGRMSRSLGVAAADIRSVESAPQFSLAAGEGTPWAELRSAIEANRRRALAELSTIERLRAVLESLSEGIIVADEQRHVISINPAARSLLNVPFGSDDTALAALDEARSEVAASDPQTSERLIRGYSVPIVGATGESLGTVTVLRDTTREQELDRLKSEFLTVVSHELQTPLTAVKGALELILDDDTAQLSRVQRRFLDTIGRNTDRLIALVGDLLDLSRLEAGRVELSPRPLDTNSVIQETVGALANLFESRGVRVEIEVASDTPPILGDRRRVEQVLTNLLANAARHTPTGGRVRVEASTENGIVALAVADSGPGVPESEREHIFDKFYRGRDTSRRGEPGSGLGLAIVKSLVDLHGGQVRLEAGSPSLPGARFVVRLPRAPDEE